MNKQEVIHPKGILNNGSKEIKSNWKKAPSVECENPTKSTTKINDPLYPDKDGYYNIENIIQDQLRLSGKLQNDGGKTVDRNEDSKEKEDKEISSEEETGTFSRHTGDTLGETIVSDYGSKRDSERISVPVVRNG